jgi:hypothetical protein
MREFLKGLEKGQRISVIVTEIQPDRQILVSYRGELFRVKNTSGRRFSIGESVLLVVAQKNPLEFSLVGEQRLFSRLV